MTLLLNSLGEPTNGPATSTPCVATSRPTVDTLSRRAGTTLARNPLRVLDSKRPEDAALIAAAPTIADF